MQCKCHLISTCNTSDNPCSWIGTWIWLKILEANRTRIKQIYCLNWWLVGDLGKYPPLKHPTGIEAVVHIRNTNILIISDVILIIVLSNAAFHLQLRLLDYHRCWCRDSTHFTQSQIGGISFIHFQIN